MVYHIILNEKFLKGRHRKKLLKVEKQFKQAGKEYKLYPTSKRGNAYAYAREISATDENCILIAMGGDGILHEVVNGISDLEKCCLGLIPVGTGNDFAAAAKIPLNPKKAADIILNNKPKKIDYIELSSGLRSVNAVGMGIDVDVLVRAYSGKNKGKSKYLFALLKSLLHFKSHNFTVEYDGKTERHFGLMAALGNGKQFGGGIKVFPDAELDDGKMDLVIVDYLSKAKTVGAFIKLMMGKIKKVKQVTLIKTTAAKFIPERENYTIQAEGELYENEPFEARVVQNKLSVFMP